MRSVIYASLFAASAYAQASSSAAAVSVPSISTVPYSNPATTLLTQTDSNGVVTGQPAQQTSQAAVVTSQPAVVTSIPAEPAGQFSVNSVPAGVPSGIQTVTIGNNTITVSVGKNTTAILTSTSSAAGSGSASGGSGAGPTTGAGVASESGNFAAQITAAGGVVAGAAGLLVALL